MLINEYMYIKRVHLFLSTLSRATNGRINEVVLKIFLYLYISKYK